MKTRLTPPKLNFDLTYGRSMRIMRWIILSLVFVTFPHDLTATPIVLTLVAMLATYNALHYVPWLVKSPMFTNKLNVVVIDNVFAVALIFFSGGLVSPYLPLIFLLILEIIALYGVAGFAFGLATELAITVAFLSAPQVAQPSEPGVQLVIYLSFIVIFSLVAEQTVKSQHEEYLIETSFANQVENDRQRMLALINSLSDAVLALDRDGMVYLYNAAALELLNTNRDISGDSIVDLLPLTQKEGAKYEVLTEIKSAQVSFHRDDLCLVASDGTKLLLDITVSPVRGFDREQEESGWGGYMVVFSDITKQKSLEEERDEFISVTSHELRTPLAIAEANLSTALLPGFAEIDDKARDLVDQSHQNILFLADLVKDLASLSRAERKDLETERTVVDLSQLAAALVRDYSPSAKEKNLALETVSDGLVKKVYTSEGELREILQNLVTNAIKYTETGKVSILLEHSNDGAVIRVKDTGIGVSATDKTKLFQKFYRSEDYRTRATGGTGLGLYISRKLAERLGMKLDFDSKLNHGSTFSLTIPYYEEPKASS